MIGINIALRVLRATGQALNSVDGFAGKDRIPIYTWITARDEKVCPICSPLDGQEFDLTEVDKIAVGTTFIEIGETVHPNCRCPRHSVLKYVREGRPQAYNKEDYFW